MVKELKLGHIDTVSGVCPDLNRKQSLIAYREDGKTKYKPWR
jgi:hypothetical protein